MVKRDDLVKLVTEEFGYERDRWGHYRKDVKRSDGSIGEYRFKFSAVACRYEIRVRHEGSKYSSPSSSWVRLHSGYYKNLSIVEKVGKDGKMRKVIRGF